MSKPYNGFTPEQRAAGGRWYTQEIRKGNIKPPACCAACGQTGGRIGGHSEDYSAPFGSHIGAFALCYRCHMAVHCRDKAPGRWKWYVESVRAGAMFAAAITWLGFSAWWFYRESNGFAVVNGPRDRTILDDIEDGRKLPGKGTAQIGIIPELLERANA